MKKDLMHEGNRTGQCSPREDHSRKNLHEFIQISGRQTGVFIGTLWDFVKIQILLQRSRVGPEILFFCQADGMLVLLVWGTHSVTRQNLDLLARLAAEPTP